MFGGTGRTGSFIGDFVHISGGTFSGLVFAPTFSANYLVGGTVSGDTITADYFIGGTYSGDGSLLTGIVATWSGGTVSNGVYFTNEAKFTNDTWLDGNVYSTSGINISGSVSVSGGILTSDYFVGDGSGLTNLPTGTYSDIYTTGATLSGDTIIFTRNDSNTYDIDLTPILNQQSITTMTWDSSIDELLTTFNDASTIGLTIDSFAQVSSTGPITAPEFYGGIFYGEFVGTFSNDIYTISGTLSGTDEIFTRTDGSTFSVDLSSLAGGGGTQSLQQTLVLGNTTGANDIIVDVDRQIKTTDTGFIQFGDTGADLNAISVNNGGDGVTTPSNGFGFSGVDPYWTSQVNDIAGITDIITLDPQGLGNGTGIKSFDAATNSTHTQHTPTAITITSADVTGDYTTIDTSSQNITSSLYSITYDRDIFHSVGATAISTLVNETSTGFQSSTAQTKHLIEAYVQDADNLLSETKNAYQYFIGVDNTTSHVNSTFTQIEDSILTTVTDNGYGYFSSKEIKPQQHQSQFSRQANIFTIEDKRAEWTQTVDDTTTLLIYCDVDGSTGSTSSIVQIKAHVRGISSDKLTGYAAEITSWVRFDQLGPTVITQIGTVDYTIKSEFTTANSSFVISGPNMYIDVTGEIGITIDWTCNVEILYDKNTF